MYGVVWNMKASDLPNAIWVVSYKLSVVREGGTSLGLWIGAKSDYGDEWWIEGVSRTSNLRFGNKKWEEFEVKLWQYVEPIL